MLPYFLELSMIRELGREKMSYRSTGNASGIRKNNGQRRGKKTLAGPKDN